MSDSPVSSHDLISRAVAALGEAHVALLVALHIKGVLSLDEARDVLALSCDLLRPSGSPALDEMSQRVLKLLVERIEREIESLGAEEGPGDERASKSLRVLRGGRDD